jgi:hypothetical protein
MREVEEPHLVGSDLVNGDQMRIGQDGVAVVVQSNTEKIVR